MNDENRSKSKDRSPNFPFITLESALLRAQQFYDEEKRGAAPFAVVAAHWNYSPASSGCKQTVGALKSYGLMEDEGSGEQRKFRLTDLALRLLLDKRPDSPDRAGLMRSAALMPSVTEEIYQKWPDGLPSPATLRHYLVFERSFNEATANKASDNIIENHKFAGLSESYSHVRPIEQVKDNVFRNESVNHGSFVPVVPVSSIQPSVSAPPRSISNLANSPMLTEQIPFLNGSAILTIQYSGEQTEQVFEFLEKYATFRKEAAAPGTSKPATDKSDT